MKSDSTELTTHTPTRTMGHAALGYPLRLMIAFAMVLSLAVLWLVARPGVGIGLARALTVAIVLMGLAPILWRSWLLASARRDNDPVLAALGAATADIPLRLRTRMPLLLVTGDDLSALFDRHDVKRFVYVGDGAIWLRVDRPHDLPGMAVAVKQWRDGRAPDGVVLSVAPARHADEDALAQSLRLVRQAAADAARRLGARPLAGYVAVYQRLTTESLADAPGASLSVDLRTARWYGVSSVHRIMDAQHLEAVIRGAGNEALSDASAPAHAPGTRAAALASLIGWTQRTVVHTLTDARQPAAPWALHGMGWIDCGPDSGPDRPWERDVQARTAVARAQSPASPLPWPLPQPLIQAIPPRFWMSPRVAAFAHAIALLAGAAVVSFFLSARHNAALLERMHADLGRYLAIPAVHDTARRDALQILAADRDELLRYARYGTPLPLSLGLYRGARMIAPLNAAIASYEPPPPPLPPQVVTLDGMSLFDSGRARLRDGSTRAMVNALEMIRAHPDRRILVAGHTDNVGSAQSNLKLSAARAEAVRDWLVDASGIAPTQFAIQGYGDTRPIADNATEAGRAKNRRVEITLVPDAG